MQYYCALPGHSQGDNMSGHNQTKNYKIQTDINLATLMLSGWKGTAG